MLVHDEDAKQMYCPSKFSHSVSAEAGETNPKWICEGIKCMAWQKIAMRGGGEGGYCGLAGKPSEIGHFDQR